jgi:hypothetical protein
MKAKRRDAGKFLASLWAMEKTLAAAGLPPLPGTWWRDTINRFYRSGKRRLVVRKGRRVFASTAVAPRLAVAEALFGEHRHVPGTPPIVYAFLSVQRSEAAKRLRGIAAILDALGVAYAARGETIELKESPAVFAVITASHRTAVGDAVAFAWLDEVARWNDDEISANPAEQVVGSLSPALMTFPDAKLFLVSSPLTDEDFHAKQFDLGETEQQSVAFGTTWDINPTFSEADCRADQPDLKTFLREYAAQPQKRIEDDWFGAAIDAALTDEPPPAIVRGVTPIFACDPAFAQDHFGWAVVSSWQAANDNATGRPTRVTWLHAAGAWRPDRLPREMARKLKDEVVSKYLPEPRELPTVYTDQAEFYSFAELARDAGINLLLVPWTGGSGEGSKAARFRAVRLAMLQKTLRIQRSDTALVNELRSVKGIITSAGNERIEVARSGSGHGDRVSALVLAASQALHFAPSVAANTKPALTDPERWRLAAVRSVELSRAKELKRIGMHGIIRRAVHGR